MLLLKGILLKNVYHPLTALLTEAAVTFYIFFFTEGKNPTQLMLTGGAETQTWHRPPPK